MAAQRVRTASAACWRGLDSEVGRDGVAHKGWVATARRISNWHGLHLEGRLALFTFARDGSDAPDVRARCPLVDRPALRAWYEAAWREVRGTRMRISGPLAPCLASLMTRTLRARGWRKATARTHARLRGRARICIAERAAAAESAATRGSAHRERCRAVPPRAFSAPAGASGPFVPTTVGECLGKRVRVRGGGSEGRVGVVEGAKSGYVKVLAEHAAEDDDGGAVIIYARLTQLEVI